MSTLNGHPISTCEHPTDLKKYAEGWERIFGSPRKKKIDRENLEKLIDKIRRA